MLEHPNPAALFYMLFEGHPDRYGHDEGRAVEGDAYEAVQRHVFRGEAIGIYPMTEDGLVRWGCSDFDTEHALRDADKVQRALRKMGLTSFMEVSRSKGYHLWVFCDRFIPAATMRRMLLFAHFVSSVPAKEVNPKQEKPGPKGYGNYVRLPYVGGTADDNGRRIMIDDFGQPIDFMTFVGTAIDTLNTEFAIQKWADKYRPPAPSTPTNDAQMPATITPTIIQQLNSYARKLIEEGVAEWRLEPGMGGRSGAMIELAKQVAKTHPRPVAKALLFYVDDRWGKYVDRDPESRNALIEDILNRAYRPS